MGGRKILIVDDDYLVLASLDTMLRSNGFETTTADSGLRALDILKKERFDLVLMDVIMRGMDGIDTLREIRTISPHTAVMLISGYSEPERILDALSNGAADYIVKPCDEEEMLTRIEQALRRRSVDPQA